MATWDDALTGWPGSHTRLPDFFIAGHAKCGTTALYEILRRHPEVFMPSYKEPAFFVVDNPRPPSPHGPKRGGVPETFDEYLSLFDAALPGQRVGEASTAYLWRPNVAGRIAQLLPDARIVAMFREPTSFLRSLHLQLVQNGNETETSFEKAIGLEQARREGRHVPPRANWPEALQYTERVRYVEQLRRFHDAFGREQVLVIIYDDFRRDNAAAAREVMRFLGVTDAVPIDAVEANPSVRVRSVRLDRMTIAVMGGHGRGPRAVRRVAKFLAPRRTRRTAYRAVRRRVVYGKPGSPDPRFTSELRRRFKPEVVALSEYLDRDLVSLWGYDAAPGHR
jgi:Sulfotransferase family